MPEIIQSHEENESNEINLNLRSDEVHEILSLIPSWIIRWGITSMFATIIMILIAAWFVKYPEIIPSRVTITTQLPPSPVVAQSSGKISKFFVEHNQAVNQGDYLAAIDNPSDIEQILKLKRLLDGFVGFFNNPNQSLELNEHSFTQLGELQLDFSSFSQNVRDYIYFRENSYFAKRIENIETQLNVLKQLNQKNIDQQNLSLHEQELAEKQYNKDRSLFQKNLISETELANSERSFYSAKGNYERSVSSSLSQEIQLIEYNKTLADLNNQYQDQRRNYLNQIRSSYKQLKSRFDSFEHRYILKAPSNGRVTLLGYWSESQYVTAGEKTMYVVAGHDEIIGKVHLPVMGSGKVKTGQIVRIKLDQFQFNEFGVLEGEIKTISLVPNEQGYVLDIVFPKGLETSYGKTLEFKPEMQGLAEIVTEDLRLLERIFNQLRSVLNNS